MATFSESNPVRAVVQRVSEAHVTVGGQVTGQVGQGLLVLLGVAEGDTIEDAIFLARKISGLRIFEDSQHKMNLSVQDLGGGVLVVSQFTLLGDCRKGRRPSFVEAAAPEHAQDLYLQFVEAVKEQGICVGTGRFQQHMDVSLVNDGPVTLLLDSRKQF